MTSKGYALARAALVRTLTAYSGITTEDGEVVEGRGTTLVDSNLKGRNDFIKEKTILIMSGDAKDEDKGATAFDNTDGKITLQGTGFSSQIKAGTIFRVLNISSIEIDVANMDAKIDAIKAQTDVLDITTFKQETAPATDVNGTTWKDLLDKATITKPTKICGFKVTVGGTWAGKAQVRITDGVGNKIFPFQDQYEQDTEFTSGTQVVLNFPVVVPVADGYKFQFRSTDGADGAGKTLQLNNLDVIEVG
ncbi:hypothetical protein ES703_14605 [subsurface metagenome]